MTGNEWMAREVLKEILWDVAECVAALDGARDLVEWVLQAKQGLSKRRASKLTQVGSFPYLKGPAL